MLYRLRQLINEGSSSGFLDNKTTYDLINEAACELVNRSGCLTNTQTITTVANQSNYSLNPDFLRLYLETKQNSKYIKYNDGDSDYFITDTTYENITYQNATDSVTIPDNFTIIDNPTLPSRVTGTCTTGGTISGGESTLTDASGNFANVTAGDIIHNTTDVSDGIVLSKTSNTVIVTALFNGTDNDWDVSDAYVIQPQGRMQLVLNPPPDTSGHTITVYYVQRPAPVYSDYGVFRFSQQYTNTLIKYAAFLYKYRDREPNFGDKFYIAFDSDIRKNAKDFNMAVNRRGFSVNLKKRQ